MNYQLKFDDLQNKIHIEEAKLQRCKDKIIDNKLKNLINPDDQRIIEFKTAIGVHIHNIFDCYVKDFLTYFSTKICTNGALPYVLETWIERSMAENTETVHRQLDVAVFNHIWEWLQTNPLHYTISDSDDSFFGFVISMYSKSRKRSIDGGKYKRRVINIVLEQSTTSSCCSIM